MKVREVGDCEDRCLESFERLTPCNEDLKVSKEPSLAFGEKGSNTNESQENSDTQSLPVRCIEEVHGEYIDANPLELLYDELILPVQHNLQHDEVVIVPDGPLYMVPFAALHDATTGLYLSETKRVRLAPSIAALKALQECPADVHSNTDALIVGGPEIGEVMFRGHERTFSCLPFAKYEAEKISEVLGVKPLIGPQATKEFVLKRLQQGGVAVIHFATHGSENGEILLAPSATTSLTKSVPEERDYILTMKEVQESGIRAQLVVLSCCHSGRGEINSEGVVGMSRAFLAAGARAVVASLWAIDDRATMEFMLKFYSHLKKGDSASTSLQQAMKEMRDEEIYSEPKYWAPFFIIGDDVTIDISV
jgi:CHAT domain-containing protein